MPSTNSILGGTISLFLPGIGLFLSKSKKLWGAAIFIGAIIADSLSIMLMSSGCFCLTIVLVLIPVLVHCGAAIFTYNTIVEEDKSGKPINARIMSPNERTVIIRDIKK